MEDVLYHVSCADNDQSIMEKGLIPGYKPGFEEEKSKYIFLAKKPPGKHIRLYTKIPKRILEDYLMLMSAHYTTCPKYNLYEIDARALDPGRIVPREDDREVAYEGIIPPQYIRFVRAYDTHELNERYLAVNMKPWWLQTN